MIKIIPTTIERVKKFNLFGCDVSLAYAWYAFVYKNFESTIIESCGFLVDHNEEDGIITHRFILWRFKLEVKSVVEYKTQPEGFRIATDFKFA